MKTKLQNTISEELKKGMQFDNRRELCNTLQELVAKVEYLDRWKSCLEDAEEFYEAARALFQELKEDLIEKEKNSELSLKELFYSSEDLWYLESDYTGFDCKRYLIDKTLIEEEDFEDDLTITITNREIDLEDDEINPLELYIESYFNKLKVIVELEDKENYIVIKNIYTKN